MMRLITIFVFILTLSTQAQTRFGIEIGVSSSNFRGINLPESRDRLISINPGVFAEIPLSSSFSFKGIVSYQRKGFSFSVGNVILGDFDPVIAGVNENEFDLFSEYIAVDPLLKYHTKGNLQFFANLGPHIGFIIEEGIADKSIDIGITSGIGLQYEYQKFVFSIEGRNSVGFTDLFESQIESVPGELRSNTYYILLGTSIQL